MAFQVRNLEAGVLRYLIACLLSRGESPKSAYSKAQASLTEATAFAQATLTAAMQESAHDDPMVGRQAFSGLKAWAQEHIQ